MFLPSNESWKCTSWSFGLFFVCSFESELKPSSSGTLEEDEGFSDWTQRLERGRQVRQVENDHREEDLEVERTMNGGSRREISSTVLNRQHKAQGEVDEVVDYMPERKSSEKCMLFGDKTGSLRVRETPEWKEDLIRVNKRQMEEPKQHVEEKVGADMVWFSKSVFIFVYLTESIFIIFLSWLNYQVKEVRKEVKVSYTSKVFLQQDRTPTTMSEDPAGEEVTSHLLKTKKITRWVLCYWKNIIREQWLMLCIHNYLNLREIPSPTGQTFGRLRVLTFWAETFFLKTLSCKGVHKFFRASSEWET